MSGIRCLKKYQKYFVLLGGFIMNLSIGTFYCSRSISSNWIPISINYTQLKPIPIVSDRVWASSAEFIGMGTSMYLGALLVKRLGTHITLLFGGWIASLALLVMTFKSSNMQPKYITLYITLCAFVNGFGSGIVYGVAISVACSWFPKSRGLVAGVLVAGLPISLVVFDKAQSDLISLKPMKRLADNSGEDYSYLILACVLILLQIMGATLLRVSSPDSLTEVTEDENSLINDGIISLSTESEISGIGIDVEPHKMITKIVFWNMWLSYLLLTASFGLNFNLSEGFLTIVYGQKIHYFEMMTTYSLLAIAVGGLFWGWIIDRFRYKGVMLIISSSMTVLSIAQIFLTKYLQDKHLQTSPEPFLQVLYHIVAILQHIAFSGTLSIFPFMCAKVYGNANFIANYGTLCTAWAVSGAIILFPVQMFIESDITLYYYGFAAGSVMSFISTIATLLYKNDHIPTSRRF